MADFSFGSTFQPGSGGGGDDSSVPPWMRRRQLQGGLQGGSGYGAAASPIQQAVQVLSLRLPEVFSPSAPIARSLAAGGAQAHLGPTQTSAVGRSVAQSAASAPVPTGPTLPMAPPTLPTVPIPTGSASTRAVTAGYPIPRLPSLSSMPSIPAVHVPTEFEQLINSIGKIVGTVTGGGSGGGAPAISMGVRPPNFTMPRF